MFKLHRRIANRITQPTQQFMLTLYAVVLCLTVVGLGHMRAQESTPSAKITSPQNDAPLFGMVTIQGTANNPNMQRYTLEFDRQDIDTEQWLPITAGPVTQQVTNGILGQWDTTTLPDGRYQIRLRVVLRDGTVLQDVVQNLHISNKEPTSLPTVQPSPTPVLATIPPTAGPSPTPIIQQPPTSTPRPIISTVVATLNSDSSNDVASANFINNLSSGFCSGIYLTIAAFILFGTYSLAHRRLRPMVRRLINNLRDDIRG